MSERRPFFVFYDVQPENTASKMFSECPSRAAKEFNEKSRYKLSETINVRNTEGRLFKYTIDQIKDLDKAKKSDDD